MAAELTMGRPRRAPNGYVMELLAGAGTMLVLLGLFVFAYTVDPRAQAGYRLVARFTSVDGLAENSAVWLAGVKVGSVTDIRYDPETREAVLTFQIDRKVALPTDSAASIVSASLLGGKYVLISPGGSEDMFKDGDSFEYVQNSVIIENLLERIVNIAEQKAAERNAEAGNDKAADGKPAGAPGKQPKP
jgi:phospholipid/cholesterol/gamma-HCH transport system substrate-binding protein